MDLTGYVDTLRRELAIAADTGGEQARELADRLSAPLTSAIRLVLLNALSDAAAEITRDLAPGAVELRLRGLEPAFAVTRPPQDEHADAMMAPPSTTEQDDKAAARINFRLPEQLKAKVEAAAAEEGSSVNAWLVRTVSASFEHTDRHRRAARGGQRFTGWAG